MSTINEPARNRINPRHGQKAAYVVAVAAGIGLAFCAAAAKDEPNILYLAGAGFGICGLLVVAVSSIILGLKHWGAAFVSWMGPVAVCAGFLVMLPLYLGIGGKVAEWRSEEHLKEYASIVEDIRSGKISSSQTLGFIDIKSVPPGVKSIQATCKSDGSLLVIFLTGTGFPLHHSGYVFNGCGTNQQCIADFTVFSNRVNLRKGTGGWYYFSD